MPTIQQQMAGAALALATTVTLAGQGLRLPADDTATPDWPRWQARLGLTTPAAPRVGDFPAAGGGPLQSAQVLGDYYFTGPGFGAGKVAGGFRATSGLLVGARATGLSGAPAQGGGLSLTLSSRRTDGNGDAGTVPYLGIGYTGLSPRGGWGFTADLGLMGHARGPGLHLQRSGPSLDDVLRDLRLTPVLQLGVSYSF